MKKFVCILVAAAFVLSLGRIAGAGDKAEKQAKPQVKKENGDKAKAEKAKAEKPKAAKAKAEKPKADKPKKSAEDRFKALDTNSDGKLSVEEFVGKREGEKADKAKAAFGKKDKDADGSLTLAEFAPAKKPKKEKKPE